jgi:hypothetical protein
MHLAVTPLEIPDDRRNAPRSRHAVDDEDGTRLKAPKVIQSQRPAAPMGSVPPRTVVGVPEGTVPRSVVPGGVISGVGGGDLDTRQRSIPRYEAPPASDRDGIPDADSASARSDVGLTVASSARSRAPVVVAGVIVVALVALIAVRIAVGAGSDGSTNQSSTTVTDVGRGSGPTPSPPPTPQSVMKSTSADQDVISWTFSTAPPKGVVIRVLQGNDEVIHVPATITGSAPLPVGIKACDVSVVTDNGDVEEDAPHTEGCP